VSGILKKHPERCVVRQQKEPNEENIQKNEEPNEENIKKNDGVIMLMKGKQPNL